ncbi:phosphoribosyl-ATP diphosphatase [Methanobacterium alkalithermotolerans]|uniref:Phosphoribosyl-ATP pyrophosphatase n=1 Tax=Methanobacterium alkalithermotolerans TaxID=2731220 RepID=A0A8T8K3Z4_9EURY|nr:phosphoribosyl-ATP diphosphatase [Methanobacterium alkalithermotolerans]QUH23266.1 phosphoribosyl-ATP diphosphatase [Methanobacterium alkalithermotolerans]RJS48825.1 MAG: phosphoribosyl-ATP diphosphatase [Methanobacterium sp.]
MNSKDVLEEIYEVLKDRRDHPKDSYTSQLMQNDKKSAEDKILEKIGEEATEVIIASKNDERLVQESADLIFHTILLLVYKGIELDDLLDEFKSRRK